MEPKVAIVGRPNVGKSTLFNRLVGKRQAIVDDTSGVTRDYREGSFDLGGIAGSLLDTAGIDNHAATELDRGIRTAAERAVDMANVCLFMFDARAGLLPADLEIADLLRRKSKPLLLLANKCEGTAGEDGYLESFRFGFGPAIRLSAEHGEGVGELVVELKRLLSRETDDADPEVDAEGIEGTAPDQPLQIAVVGRPNAGKSSLINRIVGENRLITGTLPGTTRDAIAITTRWFGTDIRIHDTAGMRRRSRVVERLERLSVADALDALRFAETVVLLLDAEYPLEVQDLRIADLAEQEGRPLVLAANKWDKIKDRQQLTRIQEMLDERLPNIRGAPLVAVSALAGEGMKELHDAVLEAWAIWNRRVSTGPLNRWLDSMTQHHPPPAVKGKPIRFKFITQVKTRPPTFIAVCSHPRFVPGGYRRYLKNGLRQSFGLDGTPIRIRLRSQSDKNPFVAPAS